MPKYNGQHEDILQPFFDAMRYKLAANSKKGTSADILTIPMDKLLEFAKGELAELEEAIAGGNCTEILLEAADASNFLCFIAALAMKQAAEGRASNIKAVV